MNKLFSAIFIAVIFLLTSCATPPKDALEVPSWFATPKQNNTENLYGIGSGYTLEEATKYALADAASRLMVSISSESNLLREENNISSNEEMRQNVKQNIEKINFTNFKVIKSERLNQKFFVQTQIERQPFINDQKERISFLERQISDLDKNSLGKNTIQRRNSLLKILGLTSELELKSRILAGAGENINLKEKLNRSADFQNQLEKLSDKTEFYFEINSPKEISQIIRNYLNKEKIKIAPSRNNSNQNQIVIRIKSSSNSNKIYEAFLTKLEIDFENLADEKVVASNSVEVTGSSSISEKEAYAASLKSLEEKITADGILKIIGITN
jgi:hypothetical protein